MHEEFKYHDDKPTGNKIKVLYYPKTSINMQIVRNPYSKVMTIFGPLLIIAVFFGRILIEVTKIDANVTNLTVPSMLVFIGLTLHLLMISSKGDMPQTQRITLAETFIYLFMFLTGIPSIIAEFSFDSDKNQYKLAE